MTEIALFATNDVRHNTLIIQNSMENMLIAILQLLINFDFIHKSEETEEDKTKPSILFNLAQ